ncbi:hypothetical protein AMTR_s00024p00202140 [Amborella trichopoda]|uniref:Uncharacterized protein n=1 Tax=Amborella trichopoda TaxID=13333 RepID=W1PU33_AMBTC|nr:hypothetical protein AMTR_s00024p00202140 [Amborella trichopoda]
MEFTSSMLDSSFTFQHCYIKSSTSYIPYFDPSSSSILIKVYQRQSEALFTGDSNEVCGLLNWFHQIQCLLEKIRMIARENEGSWDDYKLTRVNKRLESIGERVDASLYTLYGCYAQNGRRAPLIDALVRVGIKSWMHSVWHDWVIIHPQITDNAVSVPLHLTMCDKSEELCMLCYHSTNANPQPQLGKFVRTVDWFRQYQHILEGYYNRVKEEEEKECSYFETLATIKDRLDSFQAHVDYSLCVLYGARVDNPEHPLNPEVLQKIDMLKNHMLMELDLFRSPLFGGTSHSTLASPNEVGRLPFISSDSSWAYGYLYVLFGLLFRIKPR